MRRQRRELTDPIADMASRASEAASEPEDRETMLMDGSPEHAVRGGIRASMYWMNGAIQGLVSRLNEHRTLLQILGARLAAHQRAELTTRRVAALALLVAGIALGGMIAHWWAE